jgi:dethiobiotin synthetase
LPRREFRSAYVSGTDTGIGKTVCSVALLHALATAGVRATGMKPVASGCMMTAHGPRNEDALALQAASTPRPAYATVNPFALMDATAPEIAAQRDGVVLDLERVARAHGELQAISDFVLVEGVGGWLAPLSDRVMQADLVRRLQLPVVLVVGLRLGCMNHALLSARAIQADGLPLLGWIGNRIDPQMDFVDQTIGILRQRMPVPCLGVVEYEADAHAAVASLEQAVRRLGY